MTKGLHISSGQAFLPMVRWLVLNRKMRTLPKFKAEELRGNINLRLIVRNLHYGDWQLMYALIVNMDGITFAEWLKELTELLEENADAWVLLQTGDLPTPRTGLRAANIDNMILVTGSSQ